MISPVFNSDPFAVGAGGYEMLRSTFACTQHLGFLAADHIGRAIGPTRADAGNEIYFAAMFRGVEMNGSRNRLQASGAGDIGQFHPALAAGDHARCHDGQFHIPFADVAFQSRIKCPIFNGENSVGRGDGFLNRAILVQQIGAKRRGAPVKGDKARPQRDFTPPGL